MRAVVIPWRSVACEDREPAMRYVAGWLMARGFPVSIGVYNGTPWSKARAIQSGMQGLAADQVAIVDADCHLPNLGAAFDVLDEGVPWVIPHTMVHRLTRNSSQAVLDGGPLVGQMEDPGPYVGYEGGGCTVLRRETWEQVPMDPRFSGWGHEDKAWSYALRCLVGEPVRLDGVCWHLWHPPQERLDRRVGSLESRALEWEYKAARKDPGAMGKLVAEARESLRT